MLIPLLIGVAMVPVYVSWILVILIPFVFMPLTILVLAFWYYVVPLLSSKTLIPGNSEMEQMKVIENGNPLVDFGVWFPTLLDRSNKTHQKIWGRAKVGDMLIDAQYLLPYGFHLVVDQCYRSRSSERSHQKKLIGKFLRTSRKNGDSDGARTEQERLEEIFHFSGHNTGGAVDLSLTDINGNKCNLGDKIPVEFNKNGELCPNRSDRNIESLRLMMSQALSAVGFVPSQREWWHWSFGDKYWAVKAGADNAVFSERLKLETAL